jgi:hypothetical protein
MNRYELVKQFGEKQALKTSSDSFLSYNYNTVLQVKGALCFAYLRSIVGDSIFNLSIKKYYRDWSFKHPVPGDLKHCFNEYYKGNLDWFFEDVLNDKDQIDIVFVKDSFRIDGSKKLEQFIRMNQVQNPNYFGLFPEKTFVNNVKNKSLIKLKFPFGYPSNSAIFTLDVLPVLGYNYYDKVYFGAYLNRQLLYKKGLQFSVSPFYSISQNKLLGYGSIYKTIYHSNKIKKMDLGIKAQSFSMRVEGNLNRYYKINPFLEFNFKGKRAYNEKQEQLIKLEFIHTSLGNKENKLSDSVKIRISNAYFFNYFKLTYQFDNHHSISRFGFKLNSEYGYNNSFDPLSNLYIKVWSNAVYKYKYAKGNKFIRSELFAAIFAYKSGQINRQKFFLSANSGQIDYLYNEVLIGRSENSSGDLLIGNQVINSGGNMRNLIPTFPTDRWMLALNNDVNLPGILPFRVYLDLGYYAYQAVVMTNQGRLVSIPKPEFYYTSGIVIEVFKNTLEVFIPFVYSEQFKGFSNWNYNNIGNNIGFKFNLNRFNPNKLVKNIILYKDSGFGDEL